MAAKKPKMNWTEWISSMALVAVLAVLLTWSYADNNCREVQVSTNQVNGSFSQLAKQFYLEKSGEYAKFTRYDPFVYEKMTAGCSVTRPDGFTRYDYYSYDIFCS